MRTTRTMTCEACRGPFQTRKRTARYCSMRCAAIGRHRALGHIKEPVTCPTCGRTVLLRSYLAKVTKYCSRACWRLGARTASATFVCETCGRTVDRFVEGKPNPKYRFCSVQCRAESRRKGGTISSQGYKIQSVKGKPVLEHRLVMERLLGRPLLSTEVVHHRSGNRLENDPANLELWWKGQPAGQRVTELIAYVVNYHRTAIMEALHVTPPS